MGTQRSPLAEGNIYRYPGYPNNGFRVKALSFPDTPSDDGGLPGVSIQWLNRAGGSAWYPFACETDFWDNLLFFNAVDAARTISQNKKE